MGMSVYEYHTILYPDLLFKIEGFRQKLKNEEEIQRNVAFAAYIAPHLNPKKLAKTIDAFWPMDDGKAKSSKKISEERRAAIKAALQEMNKKDKDGSTSGN